MSWENCHPVTPADHLRWQRIQAPIMEALKFEGCTVEVDKVWPGLYLKWSHGPYTVKIDVEDAQKLSDVKYFVVNVRSKHQGLKIEGCVKTIVEVKRMCDLLVDDDRESAGKILYLYDATTNSNRSPETVDSILRGDIHVP